MRSVDVRIGCAGWTIPKPHVGRFPAEGSHLERYAQVFSAVEIIDGQLWIAPNFEESEGIS